MKVKDGAPDSYVLEGLSTRLGDSWETLGRRLNFHDAEMTGFDDENKKLAKKAFCMLRAWREKYSSQATYQVLYDALCHGFVNRRDLAEEFCTTYMYDYK